MKHVVIMEELEKEIEEARVRERESYDRGFNDGLDAALKVAERLKGTIVTRVKTSGR